MYAGAIRFEWYLCEVVRSATGGAHIRAGRLVFVGLQFARVHYRGELMHNGSLLYVRARVYGPLMAVV